MSTQVPSTKPGDCIWKPQPTEDPPDLSPMMSKARARKLAITPAE